MENERPGKDKIVSLDAYREKMKQEGREPRRKLNIAPGAEKTVTSIAEFEDRHFREELAQALNLPKDVDSNTLYDAFTAQGEELRSFFNLPSETPLKDVLRRLRKEWGAGKEAK